MYKRKVTVIRNPCKNQVSGLEIRSRVSMEGGIPIPPSSHHTPVTHSHGVNWDYSCLQSGFVGSKNPDVCVGTSPRQGCVSFSALREISMTERGSTNFQELLPGWYKLCPLYGYMTMSRFPYVASCSGLFLFRTARKPAHFLQY